MAKNKDVKKDLEEVVSAEAPAQEVTIEELQARNRELEAQLASAGFVRQEPVMKPMPNDQVEVNLGSSEVRVNGVPYTGVIRTDRLTAEGIMHAASSRKDRILNERIGRNYLIEGFSGGGFSAKVVGQVEIGE